MTIYCGISIAVHHFGRYHAQRGIRGDRVSASPQADDDSTRIVLTGEHSRRFFEILYQRYVSVSGPFLMRVKTEVLR